MVHGAPGPAPQTAKREQFARLIAQGTSSAEACRIVGVNPRTGKRWRHGRTITSSSGVQLHYLPVINARKSEISARYLSEAADRSMPGHWEGDLITGENNASAIGTLVERRSRATILLHLPGRHTAEAVRDAVVAAIVHLPARLRRSLTWD